jgi:hypothetical protein
MTDAAGQRLIAALSKPNDPVELTILIEEAGQVKDMIDGLRPVLNGDSDAWLKVNIGAKTVEVVVTNVVVQYRQLVEQLRKLITSINAARGAAGIVPSVGPDPTKV